MGYGLILLGSGLRVFCFKVLGRFFTFDVSVFYVECEVESVTQVPSTHVGLFSLLLFLRVISSRSER